MPNGSAAGSTCSIHPTRSATRRHGRLWPANSASSRASCGAGSAVKPARTAISTAGRARTAATYSCGICRPPDTRSVPGCRLTPIGSRRRGAGCGRRWWIAPRANTSRCSWAPTTTPPTRSWCGCGICCSSSSRPTRSGSHGWMSSFRRPRRAATRQPCHSRRGSFAGRTGTPGRCRAGTARARRAPTLGEPALVLWNPGARPRAGIVVADVTFFRRDVLVGPPGDREPRSARGYEPFALKTRDGRVLPVQVLARRTTTERLEAARHYPDEDEVDQVRVAFRSPAVPGLGLGTLTLGPVASLPRGEGVQVRGRALEDRVVEVSLESSGALTLLDRRSGERYTGLLRLEDAGDAGDTYSYCPPVRDRLTRSRGPITVRRLAAGPLVAALEARWRVLRDVAARLVVQLYADSPLVRCTLEIDNRATHHRLRARLPLGTRLADVSAVAGAAFGAALRPAVTANPADYPFESPVRTAPAHRFVAAARAARGLALLAPAFFEYEWTPAGDLIVTLFRSVGDLSRRDLPTRPRHSRWPTRMPGAPGPR